MFTRARRPFLVVARRRGGAIGAVIRPGTRSGPAGVSAAVAADAATPPEAVAAVVAKLRALGVAIPRRALVLAPDIEGRTIELPANPAHPPRPTELAEMMRWEVEPYLPAAGDGDPVVTGWTGLPGGAGPLWTWHVAGVRTSALNEWRDALAAAGARLVAAYGVDGCAAAAPQVQCAPGVAVPSDALAPLAGAARHATGVADGSLVAAVRCTTGRAAAQRAVAAVVVLFAAGAALATEVSLSRSREATDNASILQHAVTVAEARVAQLMAERTKLQPSAPSARASLPPRTGTTDVERILDALVIPAAPGIHLDAVQFDAATGLAVDGHAPDAATAATLRGTLAKQLATAGFVAVETSVEPAVAGGSTFRIRFRRRQDTSAATRATEPVR